MYYLGDVKVGRVLRFTFDTQADGLPSTLSATTVRVYKDASTTESSTGITLTADYDARTGLNHVAIDTSADGTFYSAGSDFMIVLTAGTLNGQTIMRVLGNFSIENRCENWAQVVSPTTTVGLTGTTISNTQVVASVSGAVASVGAGGIASTTFAANAVDAAALATDAVTEIVTAVFARAFSAAYGSYTFDQLVKMASVALLAKCSGMATATGTFRNLADSADVIVATIDADGNRTAVTLTP